MTQTQTLGRVTTSATFAGRGTLRRMVGVALTLVSAAAMGCRDSELLDVQTPDQITPQNAQSAIGAAALRAGAIRDFYSLFNSNVENAILVPGMMTDELINARNGFDGVDLRKYDEALNPSPWTNFSNARTNLIRARDALRKYVPDSPTRAAQIGQLNAMQGLALTVAAEIFCNGLVFSNLDSTNSFVFDTKQYTNNEVWAMALAQFDSAFALLPAGDANRNFTRVAKARTLVDLNRYADAATAVRAGGDGAGSAAVASTYVFNAEFSATGLTSGIFAWIGGSGNMGTPNFREGTNGLDYLNDPRVGARFLRNGQDGTTPIYNPLVAWAAGANSPVPVATGTEARLIEAEAQLAANDAGWLATLNALRSGSTIASQLPALTDPGTGSARQDLLFKERAMWMYLTAHRLGDLRRLIRQYNRNSEAVFPTGSYFKGGTYGTDVNLPLPFSERNNDAYKGCLDRKA